MSGPREGQAPNEQSALPVVTELLATAASHGLAALVLDDLQFADEASFDLWQELLDRTSLGGIRFAFASRLQGETAARRLTALVRYNSRRARVMGLACTAGADMPASCTE